MIKRRTFYKLADELLDVSKEFRKAYTSKSLLEEKKNEILENSSIRGFEIMRILALSIRTEQDFGSIPNPTETVGALKTGVESSDIDFILTSYRPPFDSDENLNFIPLNLRESLNKIAHLNPNKIGFYANELVHDILLTGNRTGNNWIAIISLTEFCKTIKSVPDYEYETI